MTLENEPENLIDVGVSFINEVWGDNNNKNHPGVVDLSDKMWTPLWERAKQQVNSINNSPLNPEQSSQR